MHVSLVCGNCFFQPSTSRTASPAARVNNSSKSSPSVSAASSAGLALVPVRARARAAGLMGMDGLRKAAPTPAPFSRWRKSPASPSLTSIIA